MFNTCMYCLHSTYTWVNRHQNEGWISVFGFTLSLSLHVRHLAWLEQLIFNKCTISHAMVMLHLTFVVSYVSYCCQSSCHWSSYHHWQLDVSLIFTNVCLDWCSLLPLAWYFVVVVVGGGGGGGVCVCVCVCTLNFFAVLSKRLHFAWGVNCILCFILPSQ